MNNNQNSGSFLAKMHKWLGVFSNFSASERSDGKLGKKRKTGHILTHKVLRHEALEERRLLSVSQWDDVHFGDSVYSGQNYGENDFHDDDALLIFDENMSGSMQTTTSGNPQNSSSQYAASFVVNTLLDVVNANDNVTSLREAITSANAVNGTSQITFANTLTGTITLNGTALPTLTKSMDILGPGADILTISGNNQSRMFTANVANTTVTLAGMTLTNGYSTGNGGAIYANNCNLQLVDAILTGNTAVSYGGAVYSSGGTLHVSGDSSFISTVLICLDAT
jgi:CSLREA domain-containing protein